MDINMVIAILAPIIAVILSFLLGKYLYNKPKLVAYVTSIIEHVDILNDNEDQGKNKEIPIRLHLLVIRNDGEFPARNVVVTHKPLINGVYVTFNIQQPFPEYSQKKLPNGADLFIFPVLVPNEQIAISYRYFSPVTFTDIHSTIKSDEGFAKILNIIPRQKIEKWKINLLIILAVIGVWASIYWLSIIAACFLKNISCFNF